MKVGTPHPKLRYPGEKCSTRLYARGRAAPATVPGILLNALSSHIYESISPGAPFYNWKVVMTENWWSTAHCLGVVTIFPKIPQSRWYPPTEELSLAHIFLRFSSFVSSIFLHPSLNTRRNASELLIDQNVVQATSESSSREVKRSKSAGNVWLLSGRQIGICGGREVGGGVPKSRISGKISLSYILFWRAKAAPGDLFITRRSTAPRGNLI